MLTAVERKDELARKRSRTNAQKKNRLQTEMSQKLKSQLKSCFIMKEQQHDYIILHSIELVKKSASLHKQLGEQMPELHMLNANVQHNAMTARKQKKLTVSLER